MPVMTIRESRMRAIGTRFPKWCIASLVRLDVGGKGLRGAGGVLARDPELVDRGGDDEPIVLGVGAGDDPRQSIWTGAKGERSNTENAISSEMGNGTGDLNDTPLVLRV